MNEQISSQNGFSGYWKTDAKTESGSYESGPRKIQAEIEQFAGHAVLLANQILKKDAATEHSSHKTRETVIIRNYYSPWYSPFLVLYPQPVYFPSSHRERRYKEDNDLNCLVGVIAALVGGIALIGVGSAITRCTDSEKELEDTYDFQNRLRHYSVPQELDEYVDEAYHLAELKKRVCSRIKNSALADLILRVGLAFGCSMCLVAALTVGSGALMTAGMVMGLVATGGILLKWGMEFSDSQNVREAKEIIDAYNLLSKISTGKV